MEEIVEFPNTNKDENEPSTASGPDATEEPSNSEVTIDFNPPSDSTDNHPKHPREITRELLTHEWEEGRGTVDLESRIIGKLVGLGYSSDEATRIIDDIRRRYELAHKFGKSPNLRRIK